MERGARWLGAAVSLPTIVLATLGTSEISLLVYEAGLPLYYDLVLSAALLVLIALGATFVFMRLFARFGAETDAELARLLAQERETVARLAELRAARKEIVTQVAHEIRTPLTILKGNATLLATMHDRLDPETREETIAGIKSASDRLETLPDVLERVMQPDDVDDLRVFARRRHLG